MSEIKTAAGKALLDLWRAALPEAVSAPEMNGAIAAIEAEAYRAGYADSVDGEQAVADWLASPEGKAHDEAVRTEAASSAVAPLDAALDEAWGIIANAGGGDWVHNETTEWIGAAERWRDNWQRIDSGTEWLKEHDERVRAESLARGREAMGEWSEQIVADWLASPEAERRLAQVRYNHYHHNHMLNVLEVDKGDWRQQSCDPCREQADHSTRSILAALRTEAAAETREYDFSKGVRGKYLGRVKMPAQKETRE